MPAQSTSRKQNWHRVVRTLPPPRSAILATVRPSTRPSSYSPRPKTWPPGGNPVVGSLPVGCARARNRIFSGLNFPHTQIVLLDSSLAWYCFRRLRLFNFRVAQIKECPHDDRNHWPLRVSRIGCDIRLDLSDEKPLSWRGIAGKLSSPDREPLRRAAPRQTYTRYSKYEAALPDFRRFCVFLISELRYR